jgi:hypothetical protein
VCCETDQEFEGIRGVMGVRDMCRMRVTEEGMVRLEVASVADKVDLIESKKAVDEDFSYLIKDEEVCWEEYDVVGDFKY